MQEHTTTRPGTRVPLSVLDFGQMSAGQTSAQALADTTRLAQRADELGYARFWVSEHHAIPWLASTSPPVLLGHLAASTRRIRVGSGGVMLSNHPPLVVAEQFALLEALHPGRIDLGLGRAPGADPVTAAALRRSVEGLGGEDFPRQLDQVLAMLGLPRAEDGRLRSSSPVISPTPVAAGAPGVWLLGSSGFSAQLAGLLGLPFCFAAHNGAPQQAVAAVLAQYRESFAASSSLRSGDVEQHDRARPHAMVSATVVAAETVEDAERVARPGRLQRWAERTGAPVTPFLTPADAARVDLGATGERALASMPTGGVASTPDRVVAGLEELVAATGADEVLVCSFVHGGEARVRTLELLAAAWGMAATPSVGGVAA